ILQSASAGFTPTFQATIPDVLPGEKDYTKAHPDTAPGALRQGRQMLRPLAISPLRISTESKID
ncbi:hypothetical protein, partial [Mesorhizobium sp.]|uniref:hypothetical protein n=1 Tax=Mesorhizobium sp. TaxID=1871066 RepID=UPI0025BFE162